MSIAEILTEAQKEYLDLKYSLLQKGLYVSQKDREELVKNGYLQSSQVKLKDGKLHTLKVEKKPITRKEEEENNIAYYKQNYPEPKDWKPERLLNHSKEFIDFINSFLYGDFPNALKYEPFENYKAQAYNWVDDYSDPLKAKTQERRDELFQEEMMRCKINTLYFAEKYFYIKEGDAGGGDLKYKSKEHTRLLLFLLDCGYSLIIGKPRQGYFTTTMGCYALKKALFNHNFFMKYITLTEAKGQEIFRDKIKYPFSKLPIWMQPVVEGDSLGKIAFGKKLAKGKYGAPNTIIETVPPTVTAINGGSPQLVFIDEIDDIPILSEMMLEARPTMFIDRKGTGELEMTRQLCMWGTGMAGTKGKGAYEREWYRILQMWEQQDYMAGVIPLFFSWHVRCDLKTYMSEKSFYYGGQNRKDISLESSKRMFHQHYPSTFKDMFVAVTNTLVPREMIEDGLSRIRGLSPMQRPVYGYFEPIYDRTKPCDENSDVPFRIIGATFVPVSDEDIDKATCLRMLLPDERWRKRYYQGTDPIAVETGYSKMASIIWDRHLKAPVCLVNFRRQHDHQYSFLQCLLMGLYYDTDHSYGVKEGVPELLESNIGTNYSDYCERKGYYKKFIYNKQLPEKLMGGQRHIGIDNKGTRALNIIDRMAEVIRYYYKNIYFETIFNQLDRFVRKEGTENTWEKMDKNRDYDDALFALVYAYIASLCFEFQMPYEYNEEAVEARKVKFKMVRDSNWNLIRKPI